MSAIVTYGLQQGAIVNYKWLWRQDVVVMDATEALPTLETGDTITIDTHNQEFTVENVMFNGEMVEIEGPQGGEKCLTQNVNSGNVYIEDNTLVSEINV